MCAVETFHTFFQHGFDEKEHVINRNGSMIIDDDGSAMIRNVLPTDNLVIVKGKSVEVPQPSNLISSFREGFLVRLPTNDVKEKRFEKKINVRQKEVDEEEDRASDCGEA